MKKHKSHARHVFVYLEKNFDISINYMEDDDRKSFKKGERKSMGMKNT